MTHHRFRLRAGDFELDLEGSPSFIEAMAARYAGAGTAAAAAVSGGPSSPPPAEPHEAEPLDLEDFPRIDPGFTPKRNLSLVDFVKLKGAKTPIDLLLVVGYYFEKYLQQETFREDELLETARTELSAWAPEAPEVHENLLLNQRRGFMQVVPALDEADRQVELWTLTYNGQQFVLNGLA